MRITVSTLAATLLAPALFAPALFAQSSSDIILKKDGARLRGIMVTEFLLSGVRGKRGSDEVEVPAHQVANIEWSGLPEEFLAGRAAMDRGDFENAAQMFGAVQSDRALLKADAEFFKIKAAVAGIGGDKSAAATAAEHAKSWLSANANHWRTPEAMLLAGRAERLAGTGGTAATTLKELDESAVRDGWGSIWSVRGKYELALTLLADGKASEARTQFKSAASAADGAMQASSEDKAELQSLKTLARVGEGETYLTDKKYDRAKTFFRGLTNDKDLALQAAGHAGHGEALFLAAGDDTKKLRAAQMALATAAVVDPSAGEASAKAYYYLGRCMLALGPEHAGEGFKDRAKAYFALVYTSYASSRWAGAAKTEAAK
ncbi:MAG: hypothetical protein AB8H80_04755 [Planctomycetota bacterium]